MVAVLHLHRLIGQPSELAEHLQAHLCLGHHRIERAVRIRIIGIFIPHSRIRHVCRLNSAFRVRTGKGWSESNLRSIEGIYSLCRIPGSSVAYRSIDQLGIISIRDPRSRSPYKRKWR